VGFFPLGEVEIPEELLALDLVEFFFHDCLAFSLTFRSINAPATELEDLGSACFSVAPYISACAAAVSPSVVLLLFLVLPVFAVT
jgi:hypothetical protein